MATKLEKLQEGWKKLLTKFKAGLKKKNNLWLVVVLVAPAVILSVTLAFVFKPAEYELNESNSNPDEHPSEALRHPLTGELLDTALESEPQVFGVMVENSADAWPLTGIDQAFLVIEAPVEGNIPRFITFFSTDQEVDKIGPVRSARPYYLHWAHELDSLYAHVGGSPQALDEIKELGLTDLNEFYQGEYFWRDNRRGAPHNVYTSTDELKLALDEVKPEAPNYQSWLFKTDTPLDPVSTETAESLSLEIDWAQGDLYDVKWRYQPDTNNYIRLQNNRLVTTSTSANVVANNIVVLAADMKVLDGVGRLSIDNLGEGDALMVQDGKIILGTWKKATSEERLRFYAADGVELRFNPGTTWIEVVTSLDKASTVSDL